MPFWTGVTPVDSKVSVQRYACLALIVAQQPGNVLAVHEAKEPSDIIWEEFNEVSTLTKFGRRMASHLICVSLIFVAAFCILLTRKSSANAPLFITAANVVLPPIITFAVGLEGHTR